MATVLLSNEGWPEKFGPYVDPETGIKIWLSVAPEINPTGAAKAAFAGIHKAIEEQQQAMKIEEDVAGISKELFDRIMKMGDAA